MSTASSAPAATKTRAAQASSLAEAFRMTSTDFSDQVAVRTKDDEVSLTWGQLRERVDALAGGLAGLGVEHGDAVAIMLTNRPEFHVVDLAAMMLGAAPFSIYPTYAPNQIQFVVSDAGARVAVIERQFLENFTIARRDLPDLEHLIVIDPPEEGLPEGVLALSDVEGANPQFDVEAAVAGVQPDDVLTLIYTSGTTGPPKGVELAHRNLLAAVQSIEDMVELEPGSRVISWLPAAHIAERAAHHYLPVVFAAEITCCPDPRQIVAFLPSVRPTWFFAVPRIWEKLKSGLESMTHGLPDEQRQASEAALGAALEKVRLEQRGEPIPDQLAAQVAEADKQIFSKLRAQLGLDQVRAVNVGAAPTPVEVLEFFHAIGIPLAELWGMSETCGAGTVNPPERIKIGTVGPAAPGLEVKLADDGEVLVRGGVVMLGYRNLPDKTAEAIDDDGWMHTGDIGEFDEDGYLRIVDRKKEIIINAAGKNMSPANIEATLKSSSPIVGQVCVIGDGRSYNTALVVLDADFAPVWASQHGIEVDGLDQLAGDEKVIAAVQEAVNAANEKLARVEQVKKFHVVAGDWHPGGDELTPTMKLKRKPIAEKYAREIEALYA
ncbi:MAG: long-chain fatty acid--CoA ligase [Actinobacteria bacterium]|nr:MAG: long-chain fatty acid--CoA ligase [Actinomycetota bacterium]